MSLSGVSKSYRRGAQTVPVLSGITFDIRRAEFLALMGPSGSGKSTLLNLIAGIDNVDDGSVVTCGVDVARADERQRARLRSERLGFVFQAFHLLPTLNVAENIALPMELAGVARSVAEPRVRELLARIGLADRAAAWPDVLSGGEQQRVAVARALATRPQLLLCDEPTGNLDDAASAMVLDLLHELRRAHGAALVVVTHSAATAATCDRQLQLDGGVLHGLAAKGS
jgi:putative ABC transport system ATP-binding protein